MQIISLEPLSFIIQILDFLFVLVDGNNYIFSEFQAPNWTRLNDTLNKLRIGLSNVFAKTQHVESIANKEVERAKAVLEKRRREIASKAAEMERRQNGAAKGKIKEGWYFITDGDRNKF